MAPSSSFDVRDRKRAVILYLLLSLVAASGVYVAVYESSSEDSPLGITSYLLAATSPLFGAYLARKFFVADPDRKSCLLAVMGPDMIPGHARVAKSRLSA